MSKYRYNVVCTLFRMNIDKVENRVMNCPPLISSYNKTTYD